MRYDLSVISSAAFNRELPLLAGAPSRPARLLALVGRFARLGATASARQSGGLEVEPMADILRMRGFGLSAAEERVPSAGGIALYNGQAHFVVDARTKSVDRTRQRELLRDGEGEIGLVLLTESPLDEGDLEPGVRAVACQAG